MTPCPSRYMAPSRNCIFTFPDWACFSRKRRSLYVECSLCMSSAITDAVWHTRKTRANVLKMICFRYGFTTKDTTGYINKLPEYYN